MPDITSYGTGSVGSDDYKLAGTDGAGNVKLYSIADIYADIHPPRTGPAIWDNALDVGGGGLTRSNGNLTISGGTYKSAHGRTNTSHTTALVYFEITFDVASTGGPAIGIATTAWPAGGSWNYLGLAGTVGYWASGTLGVDNDWSVTLAPIPQGTVVCVAADFLYKRIWFRRGAGGLWNDNAGADPAAGAGGFSFAGLGSGPFEIAYEGTAPDPNQVTLNAGASAFVGAVPDGFDGWDSAVDGPPLGPQEAFGMTFKLIDVTPTVAMISPDMDGDYEFFDNIFYQSYEASPPDPSKFHDSVDGLVIPLGAGEICTQNRYSHPGKLPMIPGAKGFYVEAMIKSSDNDVLNWEAFWMMPAEHNMVDPVNRPSPPYDSVMRAVYPDYEDPNNPYLSSFERYTELDIYEGWGEAPQQLCTVVNWHGSWGAADPWGLAGGFYNNVMDFSHQFDFDKTQWNKFQVVYDGDQTMVWYRNDVELFRAVGDSTNFPPFTNIGSNVPPITTLQNFYLIFGAQTHDVADPPHQWEMTVGRVQVFVPPPEDAMRVVEARDTVGFNITVPEGPTVWDSSVLYDGNVTFSNGDLTVSGDGTTKAVNPRNTGLLYFEITAVTVVGDIAIGLSQLGVAWLSTPDYLGGAGSAAYWATGDAGINGDTPHTLATYASGQLIGVAVDFTNNKLWWRRGAAGQWNGSNAANNPVTNLGGYDISALTTEALYITYQGVAGDDMTLNAGPAFTGTIPSGFTAWEDGDPVAAPTVTGTMGRTEALDTSNILGPIHGTLARAEAPDIGANGFTGTAEGPAAGTTTWDNALDVGGALALSNGNMTVTGGSSAATHARSNTTCSTGKVYFEATYTTVHTDGPGVGVAVDADWTTGTSSNYLGGTGTGSYFADGQVWVDGVQETNLAAIANGIIGCFAIDIAAGKLWIRRGAAGAWCGNNATNNPATGTGGYAITVSGPMVIAYDGYAASGGATNAVTLNAGASAFSGAVPAGFASWNAMNDGVPGTGGPPPTGGNLVGYGDSLMYGSGTTGGELSLSFYAKLVNATGLGASNNGVGGEGSDAIAARFLANINSYDTVNDIFIFEGGYNNFFQEHFDNPYASYFMITMIDALLAKDANARWLIMGAPAGGPYDDAYATSCASGMGSFGASWSVPPDPSGGWLWAGQDGRSALDDMNTALSARAGGDWSTGGHFVDVNRWLINHSSHSGQDATDDTHDIVPTSLRAAGDPVHWNDTGHDLVYQLMLSVLQAKGWVA